METVVLKVNVNCHGCRLKVKKILKKIEGVYAVNVDAEQQRVIVKGIADSATIIKKLARSGKHAELWSPKSQHPDLNQEQFSQGKSKKKTPIHHQNNSSKGAVSIDQLMYPNLHDGGSLGSDWGFEGDLNQDMELETREREIFNMNPLNNKMYGDGNYENDIGAMISMMNMNGHHDHDQRRHHHHHGYDVGGGSLDSGRSQFQRFQNYSVGAPGYGYQQHPSPLMVENLLGSQYNQNPYNAWLRTNPQNVHAMLNDNNRMHNGYMHMYHQY
ncbi:hypothetical protein BVRB_2g027590 [Beta vulgaris subsp. vulgaris]|nr:hypothetical protein BVRB_2g027590 [Beta vulgaris subsp. vulgaris]